MKINEFIERLEDLKVVAGGDAEVTVPIPANLDNRYEGALAELQWVRREPLSDTSWRSWPKDNTHQIVVVR